MPDKQPLQVQAKHATQPAAATLVVDTLSAEQTADHVQPLSITNKLPTECSTPFVAAKSAFAQMQDDRASRKAAVRSARDRRGSQYESSMRKQWQQQPLLKYQRQHDKTQAAVTAVESRVGPCLAAELASEKASNRKLKAELQASDAQRQLLKDENTHLRAYVLQLQRDAAAADSEHRATLGGVLSQVEKVQAFAAMQAMTPYPSTIRAAPHASTTSTAPTVRVAPASMQDGRARFMQSMQVSSMLSDWSHFNKHSP